jgi:hypothetical protein
MIAAVAELPPLVERIDGAEEPVGERGVADLRRIVDDANRFDMAGSACRDLLVSGLGQLPADIARGRRQYAGDLVEIGFGAPEAAAGKYRLGLARRALAAAGAARAEQTATGANNLVNSLRIMILPRNLSGFTPR